MTPFIVAIAALVVVVIGLGLVIITRARNRDDEGERFRRVAALTSKWSRQNQAIVLPASTESVPQQGMTPDPTSDPTSHPTSDPKSAHTTESVDRAGAPPRRSS